MRIVRLTAVLLALAACQKPAPGPEAEVDQASAVGDQALDGAAAMGAKDEAGTASTAMPLKELGGESSGL